MRICDVIGGAQDVQITRPRKPTPEQVKHEVGHGKSPADGIRAMRAAAWDRLNRLRVTRLERQIAQTEGTAPRPIFTDRGERFDSVLRAAERVGDKSVPALVRRQRIYTAMAKDVRWAGRRWSYSPFVARRRVSEFVEQLRAMA